jgi:hypothetical protein
VSESDVPIEILTRLRPICLGLPEVYEEPAWVGVRWRVRKKTFAHVLPVESDWPAAYAKAAATDEPVIVMTFRAQGPELDAIGNAGHPFFYAGWGRDVVGLVFDDDTDWAEVAELVTESYCVLAPQKLIALVDRPPDA